MPETTGETSDDPDWLKQVALSLMVGAGPYAVNASSTTPTPQSAKHQNSINNTHPRHIPNTQVRSAKSPQRSFDHAELDGPQIVNHLSPPMAAQAPVIISPPTAPTPGPATTAAPATPQASTKIYSYSGMSFVWQPDIVVTFASLPSVWSCITKNESSYRVHVKNPTSSAEGAFQIKSFMWDKYKSAGYPATPDEATLSQQYHVALKIFQADGFSKWETRTLCGV